MTRVLLALAAAASLLLPLAAVAEPPAELPATTLESVESTPAVGEAPAAIDEVVVPAQSEPAEPVTETEAEIAAETEREAEDETNEGGIAPAEPEAAPAAESEDEADKRDSVPPVVPEPKS